MGSRRLILCLAFALFGPPAMAQTSSQVALFELGQVTAEDRVLGRADAPVTVVEYASFTCPHCATWHQTVLPAFKARYIDTGMVRLVFRDLPTEPQNLASAAAMLARCAAPASYFDVADSLMSGQGAMRAGGGPNVWARTAAAKAGRPAAEISACMADPATETSLNVGVQAALAAGITGTPQFLVNGVVVEDGSLDGLAAAIAPLLPPASAP